MAKVISIDEIQDGMINLEPIVNRYGQTLLAKGVVLTEQHAMILRTWNIRTIRVNSDEQESDVELNDEIRQLILNKINKRLEWSPRNPIENNMIEMAVLHFSNELSSSQQE